MGSEAKGTEAEKPTQTHETNNQLHPNNTIALTENPANSYETVITNNKISYDYGSGGYPTDDTVGYVYPHPLLPMPVPPDFSKPNNNDDAPSSFSIAGSFGSYLRQRSSNLSAAIMNRVSSFRQSLEEYDAEEVTEYNLSGLKVMVKEKPEEEEEEEVLIKGRITFFSRSGCRDCTAVRKFFREKRLKVVEINVDVYSEREKELRERTGLSSVPQIFFNEKAVGGLVSLNSLRNSGQFEEIVKEFVADIIPGDHAPVPPAYGDYFVENDRPDEMDEIVRILRRRLDVHDWLRRMKIVQSCFDGNELVEIVVQHLNCARNEAVEIGKQLCRKHFIRDAYGENDFEEGNRLYRFLEHEPFIPNCYNFRDITHDREPKSAAAICDRLTKIMSAILESYASDDRQHVDYEAISKSEEFRRYVILIQGLQRVNLLELSENEKLAFFLNMYNAMVIHAIISVGCPGGIIDRRSFFNDFQYLIGGYPYSLGIIKNGILRCNQRSPYSFMKPLSIGDKRLEFALVKVNPLLHFGLCNGTKSCPKVRFFSLNRVLDELRCAAREFFENGGIEVDLEKRTVHVTRIFSSFSVDFEPEKDLPKWILDYLEPNKAGLLTHLLVDGGPVNISYQDFDWSLNS